MPLDHYVSQVHLKNFYSPALGEKMHAIRKRDLFRFPCGAKDVCRIEDNSSNSYLVHDRAIEEFLRDIEPKYNKAVAALRDGAIDHACIYVIAGFAAYVATCSPAGMRIQSEPLRRSVEATTAILAAQGKLGAAPASLGGKSLTELIDAGVVNVNVDPKYPQAMGIAGIQSLVTRLGNATWELLINDDASSPYFTSDFPVALESTRDPAVIHRLVPLTPTLALRIIPNVHVKWDTVQPGFPLFRHIRRNAGHNAVRALNTAIVQCAEQLVFHRDHADWVAPFVAKHREYRIEAVTQRIPRGKSQVLVATQKIMRFSG